MGRRPGRVAWRSAPDGAVHPDDYVFEGYEMGDAVERGQPRADQRPGDLGRGDGIEQAVEPFTDGELKGPLERWFFGHSPTSR